MRKLYLLIIAVVVSFWALVPSSIFVEAKDGSNEKPEVCSGPSEMMSLYFNFQKDALSILGGSKVEERLMQVTFSKGLFSSKVLNFPVTAIDILATSLNVKSSVSNILTSSVLLLLISASVVESNVDGFSILFRDRPIVRDYKQMLDIETQLFDVAYFRSKQIDLTRPMEGDILSGVESLIKTYKENGLLSSDASIATESMAGLILDLIGINTIMKDFLAFGDKNSRSQMEEYFDSDAIEELYDSYDGVRAFSACNSYLGAIKNGLSSITKNNSLKTAQDDIKQSMKTLKKALVGKGAWSFKNGRQNMCDNISEYEMAQLKAYWGPDWSCGSFAKINGSSISSVISKTKQYFKEKKEARKAKKEARKAKKEARKAEKAQQKAERTVQEAQRKTEKAQQKAEKAAQKAAQKAEKKSEIKNVTEVITSKASTDDRKQEWYRIYSTGSEYNPQFSLELNGDFEGTFSEVMVQYKKAQENAVASDVSSILPMGKGILDQIDSILSEDKKNSSSAKSLKGSIKELNKSLQKIVDKQCSG